MKQKQQTPQVRALHDCEAEATAPDCEAEAKLLARLGHRKEGGAGGREGEGQRKERNIYKLQVLSKRLH